MPKNGFVMRFFSCARWGVGVVGVLDPFLIAARLVVRMNALGFYAAGFLRTLVGARLFRHCLRIAARLRVLRVMGTQAGVILRKNEACRHHRQEHRRNHKQRRKLFCPLPSLHPLYLLFRKDAQTS